MGIRRKGKLPEPKSNTANNTYNDETVLVLFRCMKECDYDDVRQHDLFDKATTLTKEKFGIIYTAEGWERKFDRIKKSYGK